MSFNEYGAWTPTTYERIPYAPHNSTMHDERCDCPWCMPGEPDELSDEEAAQLEDDHQIETIDDLAHEARMADEAEETAEWEEEWEQANDMRDAMESFNEVPSYFEQFQQEKLNREALAQVQ